MILTSSISTDTALCRLTTKSVGWGSTMVLWLISVAFLLQDVRSIQPIFELCAWILGRDIACNTGVKL